MRKYHAALAAMLACAAGTVAAQAAISDNAVRIGVLTDMSGPFSDLGGRGSVIAAQMAVEDFKSSRKPAFNIEVTSADHQNRPDIGSSKAREWFDTQGVDTIVDVINSAVALSVSNVAKDKKRIVFATAPGSTRLTNEDCSPYTIGYTWDTYATSRPQAVMVTKGGARKWFFLTVDYALGKSIEQDGVAAVTGAGGAVVGSSRHPINAPDFSQYMLAAQTSGANALAIASAGADLHNAVKSAREFGITRNITLVPLSASITDVHTMGLNAAQGMILTEAFYWNLNARTRQWSTRFFERARRMPNLIHASTYSAVTNYLDAVRESGTDAADPVMAVLKKTVINDAFATNGRIRKDNRMVHDMYLGRARCLVRGGAHAGRRAPYA